MLPQYLKMIRVHIVIGGILAFTLGALLAVANAGVFNPLKFALFYAVVFFGDLSTHFSNDYFDVEIDARTTKKSFFAGSRILVENPSLRPFAKTISLALLSTSILLAALAVISQAASIELLLVAVGANFLGWSYSAPPLRLVSKGLGEIAIALAVGFAIPAVGYLSVNGRFDGWFAYFAVPFILYGFMLALSLEVKDIEVDQLVDRKTFGVRGNLRELFGLVFIVVLAAFLIFIVNAWMGIGGAINFWVVSAFGGVPLAVGLLGYLFGNKNNKAEFFGAANIYSLFAINLLMITYLFLIV